MTYVFPSQATLTAIGAVVGPQGPVWRDRQPETAPSGRPSSGSDQAREGRLVDALAVRGDEGRGTLR
jgi:hypothetical protein